MLTIEPQYRSKTYDNRAVTGLDGAEIADMREGGSLFYRTPHGRGSMIPQDHTPRRVRMQSGAIEHISDPDNISRFRIVEVLRAESMGTGPAVYGWLTVAAVSA